MSTLAPLFTEDLDLSPIEQSQSALEPTSEAPVFLRPEDALGRVSIALVGEGAKMLGNMLEERAIAERLNVPSSVTAASRLLAVRRSRAMDTYLPAVLVTDEVSDEVETLVCASRYGITVVLQLDSLAEIEHWSSSAWNRITTFEMRELLREAG